MKFNTAPNIEFDTGLEGRLTIKFYRELNIELNRGSI